MGESRDGRIAGNDSGVDRSASKPAIRQDLGLLLTKARWRSLTGWWILGVKPVLVICVIFAC
jgi:hypothetical protein